MAPPSQGLEPPANPGRFSPMDVLSDKECDMPKESWKKFGAEIRSRRLAEGWQQDELARRVGSTPRTVGRWERGESEPNAGNIISLKRELNFSDDEIRAAFGVIRTKGRYRAYSLASAKALCGSYPKLLEALDTIEEEFPVPTVPGEYGTDEKWLELLELCADSGGVVALLDKEIVGYWQCFPITDDLYEDVIMGKNVNKKISSSDIQILMNPGNYRLFFISLFLSDIHRNNSTRTLIRQDFFDFIKECAENGIFFEKIVANITGVEARQICENLDFQKVIDHPVHKYPEHVGKDAEIFEMVVARNGKRFFSSNPELSKMYAQAGLLEA